MNWAAELRAMRARAGLTQRGLARLLDTSQPHISRIEAGLALPRHGLIDRIRLFRDAPKARGVLAGILASVRRNPNAACVLQPEDGTLRYVALSAGFRRHPQFTNDNEGECVRPEISPNGTKLVRKLLESGIFNGDAETVETLWPADTGGVRYYWSVTHTPIRTATAERYLHCALQPIDPSTYERLHKTWNGRLRIRTYRPPEPTPTLPLPR
ncbi:helix-turn-helix domain-containing protein [Maricaulis sp.]|uniref:helix-turn-helix domain-containing protein n=1 Tax=Maricaulis sp. TaxID=1486257 RepID=UPI00260BFEEF|nr:helix-turn-helix domain-containing protein [Maricaulis sp.]